MLIYCVTVIVPLLLILRLFTRGELLVGGDAREANGASRGDWDALGAPEGSLRSSGECLGDPRGVPRDALQALGGAWEPWKGPWGASGNALGTRGGILRDALGALEGGLGEDLGSLDPKTTRG